MGLFSKNDTGLVPVSAALAQVRAEVAVELDAISKVAITAAAQISVVNKLTNHAQAGHTVVVQMGHALANGDAVLEDELRPFREINRVATMQVLVDAAARMDQIGMRGRL